LLAALIFPVGCKRGGGNRILAEYAYVAAPQVNVRDRLAAIYNKVTVIKNGERVEILEKQRRFARIRTSSGQEGWVELRHLVDPAIHDGFDKLAKDNANAPVEAQGATRFELNMHLTPGRDTDHLYQLGGGEKVQVLKRGTAEKNAPKLQAKPVPRTPTVPTSQTRDSKNSKNPPAPAAGVTPVVASAAAASKTTDKTADKPPVLEDWYLVRDSQKHVGWVLARMIDIDVPMEIAQYAEGQRFVSCPVINQVSDAELNKQVPQYLVLAAENKDGLPYDFDQLRVFTWNAHRHRYETAYRERNLIGVLPAVIGHEAFDKEGDLPTFTVRVQDQNGQYFDKKYKMNGPIVRRVLAPGEQPQKPAVRASAESKTKAKPKPHAGHNRHHG
jgi:hypothetical protein